MNLKFESLINHREASTGQSTLIETLAGYRYRAFHYLCTRSKLGGGDMADEEATLSKEHGGDSCGCPTVCSISSRGCTEIGET